MISRARGQRIIVAAAAHAGVTLRDDYYGVLYNRTHACNVDFTQILAPEGVPAWVFDREQLWNKVEAAEKRKDAQLARTLEISLPVELTHEQRVELLREFIAAEFVSQGMIADLGIRRSKLDNPDAHILLTLRSATATGFGPKMRQWNGRRYLLNWRESWAKRANLHLARAGLPLRIDHRTLDEQQIELTPARRMGVGRPLHGVESLPDHLQARIAEQSRIARANGAAIIEDPAIAVRALAHQRRRFTETQLSQFLRSRTDGDIQHDAAFACVMACSELVALRSTDGQPVPYTSRDLVEAEKSLMRRATTLAARRLPAPRSNVSGADTGLTPPAWPSVLRQAFYHIVGAGDIKAMALCAEEQAELVPAVHAYWRQQGRRVFEGLPLPDQTTLGKDDILIIANAELIDLKPLEKVLAAADHARAKLVLLADSAQLQSLGAMCPLHDLMAAANGIAVEPTI